MDLLDRARASVMLCDSAQAIGGKLYILGGGWSRIWGAPPYNMALAVQIWLPWNQSNQRKSLVISLVNQDGEPVNGPDGKPVRLTGEVEAGRPPGIRQGSELDVAIALNISLQLTPGAYRWDLELGSDLLTSTTFEVLAGTPGRAR